MKIKSGFVLEEVGGSYLAVAVGERAEEFRVLIKLNSTGAYLWGLISDKDMSCEELSSALISKYGIDKALADHDIESFLSALKQGGLLDE